MMFENDRMKQKNFGILERYIFRRTFKARKHFGGK